MGELSKAERPQLTDRQHQVLELIRANIAAHGYPPTLREIGAQLNIRSTNAVNDHLKALERKGYLSRADARSRGLRPIDEPNRLVAVPLIGQVSAGQLELAAELSDETIHVDPSLLTLTGVTFALRVSGQSMTEDGIFDGDFVFVKRQSTARAGETVVALVDDEATVKRYYPEPGRVRLQPANRMMRPIFIDASAGNNVRILGVVTGVFRQLASAANQD